jgi:hypothetical protein
MACTISGNRWVKSFASRAAEFASRQADVHPHKARRPVCDSVGMVAWVLPTAGYDEHPARGMIR